VCVCDRYVACVHHSDGMAILRQNVRFLHILKCAPPPPRRSLVVAISSFETALICTRLYGVTSHTTAFTVLSFHFYSHYRTMFSIKEDLSVRHGLLFRQEAGL
jgi:hypothetical protein